MSQQRNRSFEPPCEGFASHLIVMSDHCGTHFDTPNHFIRSGANVDQIALSRTVGPAVVCGVTGVEAPQIEVEHLAPPSRACR